MVVVPMALSGESSTRCAVNEGGQFLVIVDATCCQFQMQIDTDLLEIPFDELRGEMTKVGRGSFGEVYRCKYHGELASSHKSVCILVMEPYSVSLACQACDVLLSIINCRNGRCSQSVE